MTTVVIGIVIIVLLLVANGVFAMTEMAVVLARKAKLKRLSDAGDADARDHRYGSPAH
jgi:putative hemolysin